MIGLLLRSGADVNGTNSYGETAIFHVNSAEEGIFLVQRGADLTKVRDDGLLAHQVFQSQLDLVDEEIIDRKAIVKRFQSIYDQTPDGDSTKEVHRGYLVAAERNLQVYEDKQKRISDIIQVLEP